jgi:hypothetical protein
LRSHPRLLATLLSALALGTGCGPTLDDRPWLVRRPQIVGWKADPPEAPPGSTVTVEVMALDPGASLDPAATSWGVCHDPRPLDENRVVTSSCLTPRSTDAQGSPAQLMIPNEACRVFGPDTQQPAPGAPPTRPRDPDVTGGYYQPFTISLGGALGVGLERVTCDLPDASLAASRAFLTAYRPNQNPKISGLTFTLGGGTIDPGVVPLGAHVTVGGTWLADAYESFAVFDRASGAVFETRETLTASWYVTGGELDHPADEVADPAVLATATGWIAPAEPGTLELALVLRDSRGGLDVARALLVVGAGRP